MKKKIKLRIMKKKNVCTANEFRKKMFFFVIVVRNIKNTTIISMRFKVAYVDFYESNEKLNFYYQFQKNFTKANKCPQFKRPFRGRKPNINTFESLID